jgi:hypothetical protein
LEKHFYLNSNTKDKQHLGSKGIRNKRTSII